MERLMNVDPMILNRCNQKYYDKVLSKYDISYTQMFILMAIYEHKGLSMNELAVIGAYDKDISELMCGFVRDFLNKLFTNNKKQYIIHS